MALYAPEISKLVLGRGQGCSLTGMCGGSCLRPLLGVPETPPPALCFPSGELPILRFQPPFLLASWQWLPAWLDWRSWHPLLLNSSA